jgi:hypothetical protein
MIHNWRARGRQQNKRAHRISVLPFCLRGVSLSRSVFLFAFVLFLCFGLGRPEKSSQFACHFVSVSLSVFCCLVLCFRSFLCFRVTSCVLVSLSKLWSLLFPLLLSRSIVWCPFHGCLALCFNSLSACFCPFTNF